jgi:hypothetical protein
MWWSSLSLFTLKWYTHKTDVERFLEAYDDFAAAAGEEPDKPSAFLGHEPRRVDMIDAMPGFNLAYTGGRKPSLGLY